MNEKDLVRCEKLMADRDNASILRPADALLTRAALADEVPALVSEVRRLNLQNNDLAAALKASTEDLTRLADTLESNRTALNNVTEMYGEAHKALKKIRDYIETDYPLLSRAKEIAEEALTEKRNCEKISLKFRECTLPVGHAGSHKASDQTWDGDE